MNLNFEQGEKIYLIKRRHPLLFKFSLLLPVLFFITSILLIIIFSFVPFNWPTSFLKIFPLFSNYNFRYLILFFVSIFLFVFWNTIWFSILIYYSNCLVVTNRRVIQTEIKGFFNFSYTSIFYDKIQNVIILIKGFLATILHFGEIKIKTAGAFTDTEFSFKQIPDPEIVQRVILEAKEDFSKFILEIKRDFQKEKEKI